MAVSVVTFKTGDRVITELKEIFDEEGKDRKGVCLLMEEPYILTLDGSTPQYLTEQSGMEYQVRFSKWNPYSPDWQFKIQYDCVMTISSPEPGLQNAYEKKLQEKLSIAGLEAELGPIKYVAVLLGDDSNLETAVLVVIFIIIFCFDPLALIVVILSVDKLFTKKNKVKLDPKAYTKLKAMEMAQKQLGLKRNQIDKMTKEAIIDLLNNS